MVSEIIETEKYIMKIHDDSDFLEYYIKEGITLSKEDVIEAKRRLVAIRPGVKYYVYSEE